MPDPWNPHRSTPEPAPIVPPHRRKGRKPSRRTRRREPRDLAADHIGEVERRGAFGVMIDAVTGRQPHDKPADLRVPETETKRRRRQLARHADKPRKGEQPPESGSSAKR